MKASEAKKLADSKHTYSQLSEIEKEIEKAAKWGKYRIWYYETIESNVRAQLEENGFEVGKTISDRDGVLTEIIWQ